MSDVYTDADRQRHLPDHPSNKWRTAFERDRARVLHSAALRRLAAKTQVVAPGSNDSAYGAYLDSPRTRLTHSLECAQIGRELGKELGADPDLMETACLSHDLGHPPFGHTGEEALALAAADCGGFEGNAQSFRILVRLEAKALGPNGEPGGLNLTRAALDAATKYPWTRAEGQARGTAKFGVYADDEPVFEWMRHGAVPGRGCFEAQVMDWSDDVAYSVHDLEDALHAGFLVPKTLLSLTEQAELFELTEIRYASGASAPELSDALARLQALDYWPGDYDGSFAAQAALKNATSSLIGRFCQSSAAATRAAAAQAAGLDPGQDAGPLTRYAADLVVPRETRLECALLKAITARYVMQRDDARERRRRQRELVTGLVEGLSALPEYLEPAFHAWYAEAADDCTRLRVVVDQVASLTDDAAYALSTRLGTV
ncbi:deoxyguanosinetriphosphate triphosphohydrolase [Catenulispora pinisilvae]|uniref:deoxyguanosinetriphosphate triphosphohydrolase n=1 Tax=Catenulispora pinisilvae TaxID=2705253 RepID=UPI0018917F3E|nr:deoxyguanosinetriphosphate triphosphohydrolase [Catenulispora pinisilvae]